MHIEYQKSLGENDEWLIRTVFLVVLTLHRL